MGFGFLVRLKSSWLVLVWFVLAVIAILPDVTGVHRYGLCWGPYQRSERQRGAAAVRTGRAAVSRSAGRRSPRRSALWTWVLEGPERRGRRRQPARLAARPCPGRGAPTASRRRAQSRWGPPSADRRCPGRSRAPARTCSEPSGRG